MFRTIRALLALLLLAPALPAAAAGPASGYRYFEIGHVAAPTPQPPSGGLLLVGGGDWDYDAVRWFLARAGHGHLVVLRASYTDELQKEIYNQIGGITSVQTLVFSDRKAAGDRRVLDIVRAADGVFFAGGDQSNYVRFWKDTPLARLIDHKVQTGMPIGGTSAGLAILGAYSYGALDGGSLESVDALAHPGGPGVTLVRDFLHLPFLGNIITDTHFMQRSRQGRLAVWVDRLQREEHFPIVGLGIDQGSALCVSPDGTARLFTPDNGHAWIFREKLPSGPLPPGPLEARFDITGIGATSVVRMPALSVVNPAFHFTFVAHDGKLVRQPADQGE